MNISNKSPVIASENLREKGWALGWKYFAGLIFGEFTANGSIHWKLFSLLETLVVEHQRLYLEPFSEDFKSKSFKHGTVRYIISWINMRS